MFEGAFEALDISEWFGAEANVRISTILGAPNEPAAIADSGELKIAGGVVEC